MPHEATAATGTMTATTFSADAHPADLHRAVGSAPDDALTWSATDAGREPLAPGALDHVVARLARQLDEAALLFATEQPEAALSVLHAALAAPPLPATDTERRGWWMLLELHDALGQQAEFDRAALAYAQRFEASPPQWRPRRSPPAMHTRKVEAAPPVLSLGGSLDADVDATLTHWWQQHPMANELMLDLASVNAVTLAGCGPLLAMLADCQHRGLRVQLRPCDAMLALLRTLIQSGRRDDDDAGWRLLIELLRLAGDVERYEDACLAYSLTYEVSPPAAPLPAASLPAAPAALISDQHPATLLAAAHAVALPLAQRHTARARQASSAAFVLPETIDPPVDDLLVALRAHVRHIAADAPALLLDAHDLKRINFHAAAALQASMVELAAGKPVEWQGVSFLVSTLLQLSCGNAMPGIINRKP